MRTLGPLSIFCLLIFAGCTGLGDPKAPARTADPTDEAEASSNADPIHPAADARREATDPEWPGIRLAAELRNDGRTHTVVARGSNDGNESYKVEAKCGGPWRLEYRDASGAEFTPRAPTSSCQVFSLAEFQPGAYRQSTFTWNETRWNEDTSQAEQAPPGRYAWTVQFIVWDQDGQQRANLSAPFDIEVR